MQESVNVNNAWKFHQYEKDKKINLPEKDPFIEVEDQVAGRFGYMYRIWDLGHKRKICIRSTVHSYLSKGNEDELAQNEESKEERPKQIYQNTFALVEYEQNKTNWKTSLDQMMAQCLTREVQENSCKITRWIVESLLAGVEQIKFAFFSRKSPKDSTKHVLLGTYGIETRSFAN